MVAVLEHLMLIVSSNKNDTNQNAKEVVPCTYLIIRIISNVHINSCDTA